MGAPWQHTWLWNRDSTLAAIRYVVEAQGEPMAVFMAGML